MKVLKSILAFVSIMLVVISGEMVEHATDKTYPVLLIVSLAYLQWVSWDFFFEMIGVPACDQKRIRSQFKILFKRGSLNGIILLGYCLIVWVSLRWYLPTADELPVEFMKYGIIFIIIGVLARMFSVMRMLITERYRNENRA